VEQGSGSASELCQGDRAQDEPVTHRWRVGGANGVYSYDGPTESQGDLFGQGLGAFFPRTVLGSVGSDTVRVVGSGVGAQLATVGVYTGHVRYKARAPEEVIWVDAVATMGQVPASTTPSQLDVCNAWNRQGNIAHLDTGGTVQCATDVTQMDSGQASLASADVCTHCQNPDGACPAYCLCIHANVFSGTTPPPPKTGTNAVKSAGNFILDAVSSGLLTQPRRGHVWEALAILSKKMFDSKNTVLVWHETHSAVRAPQSLRYPVYSTLNDRNDGGQISDGSDWDGALVTASTTLNADWDRPSSWFLGQMGVWTHAVKILHAVPVTRAERALLDVAQTGYALSQMQAVRRQMLQRYLASRFTTARGALMSGYTEDMGYGTGEPDLLAGNTPHAGRPSLYFRQRLLGKRGVAVSRVYDDLNDVQFSAASNSLSDMWGYNWKYVDASGTLNDA
jgi:hypothetical protein